MLPPTRAFVIPGLLYLLLGIVCMALPQVTALAIGVLMGLGLVIGGALALSFSGGLTGWPGARLSFFSGLLAFLAGVFLLVFPAMGAITVAALLCGFFLLDGIAKTTLALQSPGMPGRGWVLLHGVAGLLLALLVFLEWPVSAAWVIGLFVGIHFMLKGWAWIILGWGRPPAYHA